MKRFGLILVVTFSVLFFCCDKKEGCLDPNATNYTLDAELNCCCKYPSLVAEIAFTVNDSNLVLGDTIPNNLGTPIVIKDFAIYASQFFLKNGEDLARVTNMLDLETEAITDDIILIKRSDFRYVIGTFNQTEAFNGLNFEIGLAAPLSTIDLNNLNLSESHPLQIQEDSLYLGSEKGYLFIKIDLLVDDLEMTFTTDQAVSFSLEHLIDTELGEDVLIPLKIQFDRWIENLTTEMTVEEAQMQVLNNIPSSIVIDK